MTKLDKKLKKIITECYWWLGDSFEQHEDRPTTPTSIDDYVLAIKQAIIESLPTEKEGYVPTPKQVGEGAYYRIAEISGYNQALNDVRGMLDDKAK